MSLRQRLLSLTGRVLAGLMVLLLVGTTLAFGGAVWWARPVITLLVFLLVLTWIARAALEGHWRLLKSPLAALGATAIGLALVQLAPWPAPLASRVSPRAWSVHAGGVLANLSTIDGPAQPDAPPAPSRAPLTVNRSATLRWVAGAFACLALFCVAAHFADSLKRSLIVWGSVIASLFLCATFGVVQLVGGSVGFYGFLESGKGPAWSPSTSDLMSAPNVTVLRPASPGEGDGMSWSIKRPDTPAAIGGLMGGPGAFLALAALGLPLAVGLTLQTMAPRGSREDLVRRLKTSGRLGLTVFMLALTVLTAGLVGMLAGPLLSVPFVLGILVAGLPGARASGILGVACATTAMVLAALGVGVALGNSAGRPSGSSPLADVSRSQVTKEIWRESVRIARDFPIVGSGLGSFATIHPYYKHRDEARTTALSTLLQWWAEAGLAGLAIVGMAVLWGLIRLPGAIRRVGSADRVLAFGLVGAIVCFGVFSAVHWTVELTAVALAASAVLGTCNRWLAGGTDLLVEGA